MQTVERIVRTRDQRMAALVVANEVRCRRAELKKRLAVTPREAIVVLADPPAWAATMKVSALLRAMRGWGDEKVRRLTLEVRLSPAKTVVGLSPRQRAELVSILNRRLP